MATLVVLNGRHVGEWHSIDPENNLVVGRSKELLAEIVDPRISQRHFEIDFNLETNTYCVIDLNSHNGTRVDGHRCRPSRELCDGSLIQAGHTLMIFTTADLAENEEIQSCIKESQKIHATKLLGLENNQVESGNMESHKKPWFAFWQKSGD